MMIGDEAYLGVGDLGGDVVPAVGLLVRRVGDLHITHISITSDHCAPLFSSI
jgi:hypothetical protein